MVIGADNAYFAHGSYSTLSTATFQIDFVYIADVFKKDQDWSCILFSFNKKKTTKKEPHSNRGL